MMNDSFYPFSAVVGQEDIKLALVLNLINPAIGGVLISGEKGTAKSTLVRALSRLKPDTRVVSIPLGITEDRLTGGLSIESAIKKGIREFEKGLLYAADGGILYIDEVNLLSAHIVNILLTVSSMGENIVEREGISFSHSSRFALIGSMNPEEGQLKPSFLDKFGLYVEAKGEKNTEDRAEVVRRRIEYESSPRDFIEKYEAEEALLRKRIESAVRALGEIRLSEPQYALCADIAREGRCAGHRCEIVLAETARAHAAWNLKSSVDDGDIKLAARFALPHRMRALPELRPEPEESGAADASGADQNNAQDTPADLPENGDIDLNGDSGKEDTSEIGEKPNLSISSDFRIKKLLLGSGKRNKAKTSSRSGRYVKARIPVKKTNDIALDATLRAAALYQRSRERDGNAIAVRQSDIREKVREKRTGVTILFVVDASGSMGSMRRMRAVKGAVMALLDEAYQKRDRVGIIAFRDKGGETLLNITRSVDLAEKELRVLSTGGKTPLAAGLLHACQLLTTEKLKDPDALQYLVLISDGKANVPLMSSDARKDSSAAAERLRTLGIQSMVLDTEKGFIEYGFAKELAGLMGSTYVKLDAISKSEITSNIKEMIKIQR